MNRQFTREEFTVLVRGEKEKGCDYPWEKSIPAAKRESSMFKTYQATLVISTR